LAGEGRKKKGEKTLAKPAKALKERGRGRGNASYCLPNKKEGGKKRKEAYFSADIERIEKEGGAFYCISGRKEEPSQQSKKRRPLPLMTLGKRGGKEGEIASKGYARQKEKKGGGEIVIIKNQAPSIPRWKEKEKKRKKSSVQVLRVGWRKCFGGKKLGKKKKEIV